MENHIDLVTAKAKEVFGINYLFPWQRLVIANILDYSCRTPENAETEDENFCWGKQIVLLPTGAGKSLCFLVPSLLLPGATLIIYPLLALMADQKRRMEEAGLECVVFQGGQNDSQRKENFEKLKKGGKIILANPEVLQDEKIIQGLKHINISHIAIDEAHCVSEWGDSFRPSYLTLGNIIEKLQVNVVTAFTATASPSVLSRISEILFHGKSHLVQGDTDRENIKYSVVKAECKDLAVLTQVIKAEKPLIVFCPTRKTTEKIAGIIKEYYREISPNEDLVRFYHAGLEKDEKDAVEKWFFPHEKGILVATCAFGMGVDKKNIRTVIHHTTPSTVESFVQEAGRGGRDGKDAFSVVIWSEEDKKILYNGISTKSRFQTMIDFAESEKCRRQVILQALGAKEDTYCSGCDVCNGTISLKSEDAEFVYNFIKKNRKRFYADELIEKIHHRGNLIFLEKYEKKLLTHGNIAEVLSILMKTNRIKKCKFPWKNKIDVVKVK